VSRTEPQTSKSEAAFLAQQAAAAKTAIGQTLEEMQKTAKEAADIRWWTQHYPWAAVGTAALLGFFSIPILTRESSTPPQAATRDGQAAVPSLMASLFDLVKGALIASVTAALKDKKEQAEHPTTATWPE
jgi:hypothetical protein